MIRTFGSRFILQSSLDEFGFTVDEVDGLQLKRTEDIFTGKACAQQLDLDEGEGVILCHEKQIFYRYREKKSLFSN